MSNPFKVGDKVVENLRGGGSNLHKIGVATVVRVDAQWVTLDTPSKNEYHPGGTRWHYENLRAAIAGQDYPLSKPDGLDAFITANSGHLPDGSSGQKHSAGPLYPCVLVWRDAKLGGMVYDDFGALVPAKYDVGIISPRNSEPLWFSTFDRAVSVATAIKEDLQ